jgi:hypothetical protein
MFFVCLSVCLSAIEYSKTYLFLFFLCLSVSFGGIKMDCLTSFLPVCVHLIIFWKVLVSIFCLSLCHIICLMSVLIFLSVYLSFFRLISCLFLSLRLSVYLLSLQSQNDLIWRLFIVFDFLFLTASFISWCFTFFR